MGAVDWLLVAGGGALGAVARYGISHAAIRWGEHLPLGTWTVNAVGCLLVGLVLASPPAERVRLAAVVGFLGSFTTFSAYAADTVALWGAGRPALAVANAVGSSAVGLAFTLGGLALGRAAG